MTFLIDIAQINHLLAHEMSYKLIKVIKITNQPLRGSHE